MVAKGWRWWHGKSLKISICSSACARKWFRRTEALVDERNDDEKNKKTPLLLDPRLLLYFE